MWASLLPCALQSVKGKKEINSTLTNVNKVLSGQQRRIDSIKRANVPLACLSFNYITGSLSHILPRGQAIQHHICVHMSRAAACVGMCVRACLLCLLVHSITLHLLKWVALPGAPLRSEACSHASIYRLPRIRAMLRRPLPCGSGEVTPTETEFRGGGQGELSWAQIRGSLCPRGDLRLQKDKFVETKLGGSQTTCLSPTSSSYVF